THFPWCSFGGHLNLTQFQPLSAAPGLQPLLAANGQLSWPAFRAAHFTAALRQAIFQEWLNQITRLQAAGLRISHLDSHHDVHTQPQLFWTLKRLQRQTGLTKVRLAENLVPAGQRPSRRNLLWNLALRVIPPSRTTDGFGQFTTFFQAFQQDLAGYHTLELMVHPGHPDFAAETALLETPWWQGLPFPVQFINYHEL
ncbi:MAG: ChbG/HpnK family deacetylase, partial [Desulfobacca sp.]|uniref:ChbG/HpnK family deacetylase n=1 Tax=Desulfobacca sp. TaxID=2067990 RepID=UPI00404A3232